MSMHDDVLNILLVDDRLACLGTAKFLEYKLNLIPKSEEYNFRVTPERFISKLETRLKTEPFDLIFLDISFEHNKVKRSVDDDQEEEDEREDLKKICRNCTDCKDDTYKLKNIGKCALKKVIRPNFPALPVVVFTSKRDKKPFLSATEMALAGKASFFVKQRLNKDNGFEELVRTIICLATEYDNGFKDKIEIGEDRRQSKIEAKSRDYTQTRLWQILTEKLQTQTKHRFSLAFVDLDGTKRLNDMYGYQKTNMVIRSFTKVINDKISSDNAFLGRYFREGGDEFVICWWGETNTKKNAIERVEKLIHYINEDETQNTVLKEVIENGHNYRPLNLTISCGLIVFPDDLRWDEWRTYNELKVKPIEDFQKFTETVHKQMIDYSQKLKDSAKILGGNQACFYNYEGAQGSTERGNRNHIDGYVNIYIKDNELKDDLKRLLIFILGDLAFDFIMNDSVSWGTSQVRKDNFGRLIHCSVSLSGNVLVIEAVGKDGREITLTENREEEDKDKKVNIKEFIDRREYYKKLMLSKDIEQRMEALRTHEFMRKIFLRVKDVIRKLAREEYHCERYWPRWTMQQSMQKELVKLKDENIVFKKSSAEIKTGTSLKRFYEGIDVPAPENIWVSERLSNKDVEGLKHSLMLTLKITDPVAHEFFIMESGRNMLKFQEFIEGYFKGVLQMNPDGDLSQELIDLIYRDDIERRNREKSKRIIVCRHGLYSPVDRIVYSELVEINRVRLDLDYSECEFSNEYVPTVQHITRKDACNVGIIKKDSIVDSFVNRYFEDDKNTKKTRGKSENEDINLVVYTGSEMIGPSVQLAEVGKEITAQLLKEHENDPFVLFDVFSGSSATSLPSFKVLYEWVVGSNVRNACIFRLDNRKPGIDYLKKWFNNQAAHKKLEKRLLFGDKYYIEAEFDFKSGRIIDEKPSSSTTMEGIFHEDFINKRVLTNFAKQKKIDLVIADPPHFLSIPFLFRGGKDGCFARQISKNARCLIVYYAHKEQRKLCEKIRYMLDKVGGFSHLWRVTVAGEEMAVCTNSDPDNIRKALKNAREDLQNYYYNGAEVFYFEELKI